METEERWLPVAGSEFHQVSDQGRVRSRRGGNGLPLPDGGWRICKLSRHGKGYLEIKINERLRLVHNLVLEAFVGPPRDGEEACHHPDPARTNNRLDNLRWAPRSSNSHDAALGGRIAGQKLTPDDVLTIRQRTDGKPLTQQLIAEVQQDFPVGPAAIKNIRYRQTWKWLDTRLQN